jgi:hypothetical protein
MENVTLCTTAILTVSETSLVMASDGDAPILITVELISSLPRNCLMKLEVNTTTHPLSIIRPEMESIPKYETKKIHS